MLNFSTDTVRVLSIMRLKNPSRGVKRIRDANSSKGNPLTGIVEWIQVNITLKRSVLFFISQLERKIGS